MGVFYRQKGEGLGQQVNKLRSACLGEELLPVLLVLLDRRGSCGFFLDPVSPALKSVRFCSETQIISGHFLYIWVATVLSVLVTAPTDRFTDDPKF